MNAIILLAEWATVGLLTAATPTLDVVLPERDRPEACVANETIASALRLVSGLRVLRVKPRADETLAQLHRRTDAYAVIDARAENGSDRPHVTIELHARGRPAERRTTYGTILASFEAMWPKELPRPVRAPAFAAANDAALLAACQDQVEAALSASGGAIGDAVRRRLARLPPPAKPPNTNGARNGAKNGSKPRPTVLERWLDASRLVARGEHARAFPLLLAVKNELEAGVSAPSWRWMGGLGLDLNAAQVEPELAFLFGRDRLVVLELDSGRLRLSMPIDKLEPRVVSLGPTRALAFGANRVYELDLESPARVRRQLALEGAAPEVVVTAGEIILAGSAEVVALARETDQELWRQELTDTLVAGPALLSERLIIPGDARLFVLARESGKILETLDLPDRLAGPIHSEPSALFMVLGGDRVARLHWNGNPNLTIWEKDLFGASWPPVPFEDSVAIATRAPKKPPIVSQLAGGDRPVLRVLERGADAPLATLPGGGLIFADAKRTTLTGKDAKGRVTLRARSPSRFESLTSGVDHVFAQAGPLVLTLDPKDGETTQRFELPETPRAVALSEGGGVALLSAGVVLGLPPPRDLRLTAFRKQLNLELAEAAVRTGRVPQGKKLAEETLELDPDNLEALAIVARASPKDRAASAWYGVLQRAPSSDPLRETAKSELDRLVGLRARVVSAAPIRGLVLGRPEVLVFEDERRIFSWSPKAEGASGWSIDKKEAGRIGELLRADEALIAPITGRSIRNLGGRRPMDEGGLFFRTGDAEPTVSLETPTGQAVFSQRFEERDIRRLESSSDPLLFGDDGELGTVHALSAKDGARLWMRPFEERIEAAHALDGLFMMRTPTRLLGVEAATGKLLFETALPKNEVVRQSLVTSVGLLLVTEKRLTLYETKKGRAARVLPLAHPPVQITLADPHVLVSLEGGALVAFDLAKGRRGGMLELATPRQIFAAGSLFGLVEADGVAFSLFEASRLLAP